MTRKHFKELAEVLKECRLCLNADQYLTIILIFARFCAKFSKSFDEAKFITDCVKAK